MQESSDFLTLMQQKQRVKTGMLKGSQLVAPRDPLQTAIRVTKEIPSMKQANMVPAEAICLNDQIIHNDKADDR